MERTEQHVLDLSHRNTHRHLSALGRDYGAELRLLRGHGACDLPNGHGPQYLQIYLGARLLECVLWRFWHLVLHRLVTGGRHLLHGISEPDPHRHVQRDGRLGLREPYCDLPALGRHHGIRLLLHERGACDQPGLHAELGRLRH